MLGRTIGSVFFLIPKLLSYLYCVMFMFTFALKNHEFGVLSLLWINKSVKTGPLLAMAKRNITQTRYDICVE